MQLPAQFRPILRLSPPRRRGVRRPRARLFRLAEGIGADDGGSARNRSNNATARLMLSPASNCAFTQFRMAISRSEYSR